MDDRQVILRQASSVDFLSRAGWGAATKAFLAGDASNRRYHRLADPGRAGNPTAVLMDAPPELGEDTAPFIAIAQHLRGLGLSAPDILAQDRARGFLLLEDLGDDLFARVVSRDAALEEPIYAAATDVLAHLQAHPAPKGLPAYDTGAMARAATLAISWYSFAITGRRDDPAPLADAVAEALDQVTTGPPVMILRDYHAENLLWLPSRSGLGRVGLLDFQNAETGLPIYDLISLIQDARRDVSQPVGAKMLQRFAGRTGTDHAALVNAAATAGAQRALRILGAFARLSLHFGKPGYVRLMPRVWSQLQQNLHAPHLAKLSQIVERTLPPPEPSALQRIMDQCGTNLTL